MRWIQNLTLFTLITIGAVKVYPQSACLNLFDPYSRVEIESYTDTVDKNRSSEIKFTDLSFSTDADTALIDFLTMASYTRGVEVVKTKIGRTRISKFDLGLDLGKGYSLEIRYRADERGELRFTAESATLISPTNRQEKIAPHLIDFNELKFKQNTYDLSDIFPDGQYINLKVPIEIKGNTLPIIEKMIQHLPFFSKQELRKLVQSKNILKIKTLGHFRFTKNYLKEFALKAPFKLVANTTLAATLILLTGHNFKDFFIQQAHRPDSKAITSEVAWSAQSLQKLQQTSSPEVKTELQSLISSVKTNLALPNLNKSFKANSTDFIWIIESKDPVTKAIKIMLFISTDSDSSNTMSSLGVEINPLDYPKLIEQAKNEGRYLRGQ